MKSVTPGAIIAAVRDEIDYDLSLQDALARDYANMSAVSRMIQPRIEERLGTHVNIESVTTSLKRLRGAYTAASTEIRMVIAESVVNVRTHVSKISVEKTRKTLEVVSAMLMGSVDAKLAAWLHSDALAGLIASGRVWIQDGIYDRKALATALSAADAVWLGYRDHFGSSSVLWEAAQAGLPVLGRHTGLIALEIRANDIGETVNTDDSAAVARALTRVLCDGEVRGRWSRNARQSGALHTPVAFGECVVSA